MKRMVLAVVAVVGLSVPIVGAGSALAGAGFDFQDLWQYRGQVETGTLPSDSEKPSEKKIVQPDRDRKTGSLVFEADPGKWRESGG